MIEEKIVVGSEFPLNGLLTIPDGGSGPYPAAVLVHGSGPSDMNEAVYGVKPFQDLAAGLAQHNIASIRYDKRTFAHAKQMAKLKQITVKEETIEDAILATDILRNDPKIDPNRIFIIGHSMGGMLAPRIDVEGGNYAGLVILAGTPRRLEEVMLSQNEEFLQTANPVVKWIGKRQVKKLFAKFEHLYDMSDEEARKTPVLGKHVMAIYFKDMGKKQVREYLEASTKPVFVLHGEGDFQVTVKDDFALYKDILKNHPNATCKLYPGLNHMLMPVVYGDIRKAKKEYSKPQHMAEYVIADIAAWIHKI
ncbi:MAG: alpha/beta fold hydrolase [Oscillospiraceae bacterium]|nr:alpha/beta fold hydrolase [Oscillospiraceae bacterium]